MRKVIGTGETTLDIIFRSNQPEKAVPGGSVFNAMVSLARCGIPALFISELGKDRISDLIRIFMQKNHLTTDYLDFYDCNSPLSLAFLDKNQNASYEFFKSPDFLKRKWYHHYDKIPGIQADDILIMGSFYAVDRGLENCLRNKIINLLHYAAKQKAIIYYDINFRKAHAKERSNISSIIKTNFKSSTIVRCSAEDLDVLYPRKTVAEVYEKNIAPYCKIFIVTQGEKEILLKTETLEKSYPVEPLVPVSTIGAGDNFNAGLIYGLMLENILLEDLKDLSEDQWDKLIEYGKRFAAEVCKSMENYVGENFIS